MTHLEPLAIASNVTQAEHTRLDHVLITLGNLFRIYDGMAESDEEIQVGIQASLETRWAKADQDPFILYSSSLIFGPTSSIGKLSN